MQVADYIDDEQTRELECAALAEHCLTVDPTSQDGQELQLELLQLHEPMLCDIFRGLHAKHDLDYLLRTMPPIWHSRMMAARLAPVAGGSALSIAVRPPDIAPCGHLANAPLGDAARAQFLAQLASMQRIVSVDLSGQALGDAGLAAAMRALRPHTALTSLSLARNKGQHIAARIVADALPRWPSLQNLELHGNLNWEYEDQGPNLLAAALFQLTALTRLAGPCVCDSLATALEKLTRLRELDFDALFDERVIVDALAQLPSLTRLVIHDVIATLGNASYASIDIAAKCASLRYLDASMPCIDGTWPDGTDSMRSDLSALTALEHLDATGVCLGHRLLDHAGEVLPLMRVSCLTKLTFLAVGMDHLDGFTTAAQWQALAAAIAPLTQLRELRARMFCADSEEAAGPWPAVFAGLPHLHTLHWYSGTEVGLWRTQLQPLQTALGKLTQLKLNVPGAAGDMAWLHSDITRLTGLLCLSLAPYHHTGGRRRGRFCAQLLERIADVPQLQSLHIVKAVLPLSLADLGLLKHLTMLALDECRLESPEHATALVPRSVCKLVLASCKLAEQTLMACARKAMAAQQLDFRGQPFESAAAVTETLAAACNAWRVVLTVHHEAAPDVREACDAFNAKHGGARVCVIANDL